MNENGLNFVESILEICSIELDEGGVYTCNASNGFTSVTNSTTLTVADNRGMSRACTVLLILLFCGHNIYM